MSDITYTLEITAIQKHINTGAVDKIFWSKTGTDVNGVTGRYDAITTYISVDVNTESFVEYDNLTENIVKSWIKLDPQYQNCEATINNRIKEASIQRVLLGSNQFPWVKTSVPINDGDTTGIGG